MSSRQCFISDLDFEGREALKSAADVTPRHHRGYPSRCVTSRAASVREDVCTRCAGAARGLQRLQHVSRALLTFLTSLRQHVAVHGYRPQNRTSSSNVPVKS